MTQYSAKDRAFDAERAKFRHTCNELNRRIQKEQQKQNELCDEIRELRNQIASKNEWIERLLAYTELTPAEIKNLIADEKHTATMKQNLNSLFGNKSPFTSILNTFMQTTYNTETPVKIKLPIQETNFALVAQEATNKDKKPCPSKESCIAAANLRHENAVNAYMSKITSIQDLVYFMYHHMVTQCEEYTDWEAREAAYKKALEFGIDLDE